MTRRRRSQREVVEAHGKLKRAGREWNGPCPLCGGEDRFYVKPDGGFYCRHCLPDGTDTEQYVRMLQALGFAERGQRRGPRWQKMSTAEMEAKERRRVARAQRAIALAHELLGESEYGTHPYLEAKGHPKHQGYVYQAPDDFRWKARRGKLLLLVPVLDHRRSLLSLQTIDEDGRKMFLPGSDVKGGRFAMEARAWSRRRWYCEGLVTALSLRQALRELRFEDGIVVCFSDHGVKALASVDARAFIIADNDKSRAGEKAAKATGRPYWLPDDVGLDFNDYVVRYGVEAGIQVVRRLVRNEEMRR